MRALLVLLMLLAPAVHAQPKGLEAIAGTLPPSAEFVMVIEDPRAQLASPAGQAAAALWHDLGDFGGTSEAWRELAGKLELEPADAFDELLGRRIVFVARNLDEPGQRQWALITRISAKTELSLRMRLKPSPRLVLHGLPVLALERGQMELVTAPFATGSLALIAPAGSRTLLEELIPTLRNLPRAASLAEDALFKSLGEAARGDIAIFARTGQNEAIAVGATHRDSGWDAQVRIAEPLAARWISVPGGEARAMFPPVDVIEDDAMLAIAGRSPALLRILLGGLVDGPFDAGAPSLLAARTSESGTLALLLAQPIGPATPTAAIDRSIRDRLAASEVGVLTPDATPADLAGMFPDAVRVLRIRPEAIGPVGAALAPAPRLAWLDHRGPTRWLIGRLDGASDEQQLASLGAALDRRPIDARQGSPISAGWLRPRELLLGFADRAPWLPDAFRAFRHIERVGWTLSRRDDGTVTGAVRIDMAVP